MINKKKLESQINTKTINHWWLPTKSLNHWMTQKNPHHYWLTKKNLHHRWLTKNKLNLWWLPKKTWITDEWQKKLGSLMINRKKTWITDLKINENWTELNWTDDWTKKKIESLMTYMSLHVMSTAPWLYWVLFVAICRYGCRLAFLFFSLFFWLLFSLSLSLSFFLWLFFSCSLSLSFFLSRSLAQSLSLSRAE